MKKNFITNFYRNFLLGIKNLKVWFPIIWKDRDWDDSFIFEVLKFKLKKQAKYISEKDRHLDSQLDAKRMRLCVDLIDKIQSEFYQMEYFNYLKDENWFELEEDSEFYVLKSELEWEKLDEYIKKYPLIYKRVLNGEGPFKLNTEEGVEMKKIICMNIAKINGDRAQKLLFKILEENIRRWWD
jgi:hypothetical protein